MTETIADDWAEPRARDFAERYGIDDAGRQVLLQLLTEAFHTGLAVAQEDADA